MRNRTRPGRHLKVYAHGDDRRYLTNRCRCDECREAHRVAAAERRRQIAYGRWGGYVNPTGTVRRVQALSVVGWSCLLVARKMGSDPGFVREIAREERQRVHADTAAAIRLVYDGWCTDDGPSRQAIGWARKKGWHGPEAWSDETIDDPDAEPHAHARDYVDEVKIQRALAGVRMTLTDPEATAALLAGIAKGEQAWKVRDRLHIGVERARKLLAAAQPAAAESEAVAA